MKAWQKVAIGTVVVASFTLPIFRSGGRIGLTFWGWVVNHTIFGPAVEYVPEESYRRELEGVEITRELGQATIPELMAFHQINEKSATRLANRGK